MASKWTIAGVLVAMGGFCSAAMADMLHGSRFEPSEVQHRVRVVLHRGHAQLFVERVLYNPGNKTDQAVLSLDLPEGAVATSLKTLGTVRGKPQWFFGELKEAEEAAQKYQELTGIGGYYPKDPALLSWRSQTNLMLQVFPCMPKQNKTLGYTLELPMRYKSGRYQLSLPALGLTDKPAKISVEASNPSDRLFVNEIPESSGTILRADRDLLLALEPNRPPVVDGELAVADTGLGQVFANVRFALSKRISEVPRNAYVVLGIDNSRSMEGIRESAVEMAEATLKLFPNAQVQILDFNRRPRPRFATFVPKQVALTALMRERNKVTVPESGNGSEIDLALAEAERVLEGLPKSSAKRILFFTDTLVPARITPKDITASVGRSGAVLHIVQVEGGAHAAFARNDSHPWAEAPRVTGGLVWGWGEAKSSGADNESSSADDESVNPYEQLVRPIAIDHAVYHFANREVDPLGSLREGSAVERQGIYPGEVRWVRLTGELWSQPFRMTLQPDPAAEKRWSALVFGTSHLDQLSEPEMMVLANRGKAVSPVTSYLAVEPGVRPSIEGLNWDDEGFGMGGLGLSGIGEGGGGRAEDTGLQTLEPFDPQAYLTAQLASKWAECKGSPGEASVTLETNYKEIADVNVQLTTQEPDKFSCLREAAWSLDLRGHRFIERRQEFRIQL